MEASIAKNIQDWVSRALMEVRNDSLTKDIHIDELLEVNYQDLSKKELLNYCLSIVSEVSGHLLAQKINTSAFGIFMNINLMSESNSFHGKPKNLTELIDQIDAYTPPEIVIYKEILTPPHLSEFYRVPLFYEALTIDDHVQVVYKEYRSSKEILADENYTRELNFVFVS